MHFLYSLLAGAATVLAFAPFGLHPLAFLTFAVLVHFWLDAPPKRVSAPDTPPPFAPPMEAFYVPDEARIVAAVRSLF